MKQSLMLVPAVFGGQARILEGNGGGWLLASPVLAVAADDCVR